MLPYISHECESSKVIKTDHIESPAIGFKYEDAAGWLFNTQMVIISDANCYKLRIRLLVAAASARLQYPKRTYFSFIEHLAVYSNMEVSRYIEVSR